MFARSFIASMLALALFAGDVRAQDSLTAAREAYASAEYDKALGILDRLAPAARNDERQSIDLYRTLCLLAVDRRDEAERVIEAIVTRNPLYRPADDLSPRMRVAFSDARKRLLPTLVQQRYADAKNAFDRKEFEAAAEMFDSVIATLNDPDLGAAAAQPPLSDLRTLAAGFHDLSVKAIPPPPPPPPAPAPEPPPPPAAPRIFEGDEPGVRAPVTIAQELPPYPGAVSHAGIKGLIEVVINEQGAVESARMAVPVSAAYDKLLLSAVQKWQFSPAVHNGVAVKFRKRIQVNIAPPPR